MAVSREEVIHIAKLARLELTPEEITQYTVQLSSIVDYVAKLNELDLENTEPMRHVLEMVNVMREDREMPSLDRDEVLANAPDHDGTFFKVPQVVKTES